MITIITHAVFYDHGEIHGPADAVSNYLSSQGKKHIFIKHPLWGKFRSKLFIKTKAQTKVTEYGTRAEGIVRYPIDIFLTLKRLWREDDQIIIGIDPLNCIAGVVLRRLGKCKKLIYFTADFADVRFPNKALNTIYHVLDHICVKQADYCWGVSTRIMAYRQKQGVAQEKNIFVPNAPAFAKIRRLPIAKIDKYQLILVSNLQAGVVFDAIFAAIKRLKQQHPRLHLVIIGGGEGENEVRAAVKKFGLDDTVTITGRLAHTKVHRMLAQSGIGIALYDDTAAWRYYSDSMKARDYMACGLPVLISGDLATVDDIVKAKAGLAIKPTKKNVIQAVEVILKDYPTFRKNAINLAKLFDIEMILRVAFAKIES